MLVLGKVIGVAAGVALVLCVTACGPESGSFPKTADVTTESSKDTIEYGRAQMSSEAKKVFVQYLRSLDDALNSKALNLDASRRFATSSIVSGDQKGLEQLLQQNLHVSGRQVLTYFKTQRFDPVHQRLIAYTCTDVSKVRVLDRKGHNVTPVDRADLQPGLVTFGNYKSRILVEKNGAWAGGSVC